MLLSNPLLAQSSMKASTIMVSHMMGARMIGPRTIGPVHSAALLQGPGGVALHLHGEDGAMTQIPLTIAALREIAALAGAAAAAMVPEPVPECIGHGMSA
jgi:hypothetical protein